MPVLRTTTFGLRATVTSATPTAASAPIWAAPIRIPAESSEVAGTDVATDRPDVGAEIDRSRNVQFVVRFDNKLDRDDRVRTVRDGAAGGDRHRLTGHQRPLGRQPGGDPGDDGQAAGRVVGPQGVAVHGGARERRQVDRGA